MAPVTRTIREIPVEVSLGREDGLPTRCVANLDDVTTIPTALLQQRLAVLSSARMADVEAAIRFALDLG